MREIKFRVFTKEDGLCDVIEIDFDNKNVEYILNDFDDSASVKFNKCKLLQYTGLKDKNGVEIYEGDIVKTNQMYNKPCAVEFYANSWCFDIPNSGREGWCERIRADADIEVIGNIYENKELLDER